MKDVVPSIKEIFMMAHVERFCEQHRHHLIQPLHVTVTDAACEVTEYVFYPEVEEEVNTLRRSPEPPHLSLPIVLHITDSIGSCVETCLTELAPPPEGRDAIYPEVGKA